MRGVPNNPVSCTRCGDPLGYPKDGLCVRCRPNRTRKYFWKPEFEDSLRRLYEEHFHNRRELSAALTAFAKHLGWPRTAVQRRASQLCLTQDVRRRWQPQEIEFLREYAGSKSLAFFERKLRRNHYSVKAMLNRLHLSSRITEGYSREDVRVLLGISWKTLDRWLRLGWLKPSPSTDRIQESQVLRFIKVHPEEYRLKRVDEAWFKGLLFPMMGRMFIDRRNECGADWSRSA